MNNTRSILIENLSKDVPSIKPLGATSLFAVSWFVLAFVLVSLLTSLFGPFRASALSQLIEFPLFTLGMILGITSIACLCAGVFRLLRPGINTKIYFISGAVCLCAWLGLQIVELWTPAFPVAMNGKRPHCFVETIVYALPTLGLGWFFSRKGFVLNKGALLLGLGLSAGLIPAWLMQMACMYGAKHNLIYHFGPVAITVGALMLLYFALRRKISP